MENGCFLLKRLFVAVTICGLSATAAPGNSSSGVIA